MSDPSPRCLFVDLDDTLYPPRRGIWQEISRRINRYMVDRVGISDSTVDVVRERFFQEFGTTLNGLRHEYSVDPGDYLAYVHDIPLDRYLVRDMRLREMLVHLPQQKFIFSNADMPYITRVLSALGIEDLFDGIIDIYATAFACKPMDDAYRIALERAENPRPDACWLVDDLPRNLAPAAHLGMTTVLVRQSARAPDADHQIDEIHALGPLLASAAAANPS
jgi:putative hydrolase of the HAD superfamily